MGSDAINRQIILVSRPTGMPENSNFSIRQTNVPVPKKDQVLIRTLYLTVDPYMRGRMNDRPSYIEPFQLNQPPTGGVVGRIIESKSPKFNPGDIILGFLEWADYVTADDKDLQKLDSALAPITTALGVLGMPGMTAYFGLLDIGQPKKGETVVVSGAAGAVGMIVGQIAKIIGCRVVGIVGSDEKKDYLVKELGFDAAINYKESEYAKKLKEACPNGADIYFDNVGGDITDQVIAMINKHARIILCGQISVYNLDKPNVGPRNSWMLLTKSAMMKGFIVTDYQSRFHEGVTQLAKWIKQGKVKYREHIIEGLENAPKALIGLFKRGKHRKAAGKNF